jgi:hypothetical protein
MGDPKKKVAWLSSQIDFAKRSIDEWPEWIKQATGRPLSTSTSSKGGVDAPRKAKTKPSRVKK